MIRTSFLLLVLLFSAPSLASDPAPLKQDWDYALAMQKVAATFQGRPGVVLHVGDSITHANPYGQWARFGKGQSKDDQLLLKWMHCGADDDTDGWFLARFDHPDGGRSHTAAGGMRADELLKGGKQNLPPLAELLKKYQPQMVVLMIGTNDVAQGRKTEDYIKDVETAVRTILDAGSLCILSTIPPYFGGPEASAKYNDGLRGLAKKHSLPIIDYEQEILRRRPRDWNGTLMQKNDAHPSAGDEKVNSSAEPTEANLATSGYLLRGWLSVKKIGEVKRMVLEKK
ncbi:MAG: SGNH/GDSL hydrolase family protein [Planctomycetales bacterium]|nr:SGNH/GDSL hydrolase family protein [Planctomycetales bacterium]